MTFDEFVKLVDETFMNHQAARSEGKISAANQWRYGQTIMNVLHNVWPEKYSELKGSDYDCFYDNRTINLTLEKLEKDWSNK